MTDKTPPSLGTPHAHIYTTYIRAWDKAKAYARENLQSPHARRSGAVARVASRPPGC